VAKSKHNLALAYGSMGDYEKQLELLKEVLNTEVAHYKTGQHSSEIRNQQMVFFE